MSAVIAHSQHAARERQEWDVSAVGSHYTISNVGNGMVLDARNCGTADGTVVRQWAQLDNVCQQWDIKS